MNQSDELSDRKDEVVHTASEWFVRRRSENFNTEHEREFQTWLNAHPEHMEAYQEFTTLWEDPLFTQALLEQETSIIMSKQALSRPNYWLPRLAIAMVLLLLTLQFTRLDILRALKSDYSTAIGEQRKITLTDHSTITLNTDSAVDIDYHSDIRRIRLLKGEAFYNVVRDTKRPFQVVSHFVTTEVLGTQFIVRQTSESDTVTVISGQVSVADRMNQQLKSILTADQQISGNELGLSSAHSLSAQRTAGWLGGHLVVESRPLAEVIEEIQRYRSGIVLFKDEELKQLRVSGRFNLRQPDTLIETLRQTLPIKITQFSPLLTIIH